MTSGVRTDRATAVTANALGGGEVVFLASSSPSAWTVRFEDAAIFDSDVAAEAALSAAAASDFKVVDAYLIALDNSAGVWTPLSLRERIRALGPTTEPQLGPQARGGRVVEALQAADSAARSSGRIRLIRRR